MKLCTFEGCERKYAAKGLCKVHNNILKKEGKLRPINDVGRRIGSREIRLCDIEGCGKKHQAKGLCQSHWSRQHYGRSDSPQRQSNIGKTCKVKCDVDNCDKFAKAKGWCMKHYCRNKRHGDPLTCYRRPRKSAYISLDNILKNNGTYSKADDEEIFRENFSDLYNRHNQEKSY